MASLRSDPKRMLFINDHPAEEIRGVYGLHRLEFLARALKVEYRECLGRGTQAATIREALREHFRGTRPSPATA